MSKFKLFVENFLVYGLGGILNRIVPFLMLPIITRLMPNTKYFGLNDLSNTIVQFGTAIAIMGMYDAVFRLFFDKDDLPPLSNKLKKEDYLRIIDTAVNGNILVD